MLHAKFWPNLPCGSEENVDFIWFCYFEQWRPYCILDQAEYYHLKVLQTDHAACEI